MHHIKSNMGFWHAKASNSKVNCVILLEFELCPRFFMPIQVIGNFHKDAIKTKKKVMLRTRSNMPFFDTQVQLTPKWTVWPCRDSNLPRLNGCPGNLQVWQRSDQHFPHYKSMGAFGCRGNQSFYPICPKTLYCLSPTLVMLHIKYEHNWPTDSEIFKFESVADGQQQTDSGPLV